jgi:GT2 family glycosyltransferase
MNVDVVIPTWNGAHLLPRCLAGLAAQTVPPARVIVVDNGSTDGTAALLRDAYPYVDVVALPDNLGFAGGVNAGIAASTADVVALLNNDAVPEPGWIAHGLAAFAGERVGAVACLMLDAADQDRVDSAGIEVGWWTGPRDRGRGASAAAYDRPGGCFAPCGGAAFYRRSALDEAGGLDETYFAYFEDVDLGCRLLRAGWRTAYAPRARVAHEGGATLGHFSARHVRLLVRNELLTWAANLPPRALLTRLPLLLARQGKVALLYAVRHRHPGAWAAGVGGAWTMRAHVRAKRAALPAGDPYAVVRAIDGGGA